MQSTEGGVHIANSELNDSYFFLPVHFSLGKQNNGAAHLSITKEF